MPIQPQRLLKEYPKGTKDLNYKADITEMDASMGELRGIEAIKN